MSFKRRFIEVSGTAARDANGLVHWLPHVKMDIVMREVSEDLRPFFEFYSACTWAGPTLIWFKDGFLSSNTRDVNCLMCLAATRP
jgi:hypothetical protein